MPLLPQPYPDELIGSVLARAVMQSGLPLKALMRALFGRGRSTSSFLMTTDFQKLPALLGIDAEEILANHTMFAYAVAFAPRPEQARLRARFLCHRSDECIGSITKNISHGVPLRRLCPSCVSDELASHGEAYWHRSHHLPGVFLCSRHNILLRQTDIPLKGAVNTRTVALPSDIASHAIRGSFNQDILLTLMSKSICALNGEVPHRDNWAGACRALVEKLGYVSSSDSLAGRKFSHDLHKFFGERILVDSGCYFKLQQRNPWPALLVRESVARQFATPKVIFFQTFCELAPSPDQNFGYKMPGRPTVNFAQADRRAAAKIDSILRNQAKAGRRVSVSFLLQAAGVWQSFRHHRSSYPLTCARILAFRSSNLSERQTGLRPYWRKRLRSRAKKKYRDKSPEI
jgi:hypothetical protein